MVRSTLTLSPFAFALGISSARAADPPARTWPQSEQYTAGCKMLGCDGNRAALNYTEGSALLDAACLAGHAKACDWLGSTLGSGMLNVVPDAKGRKIPADRVRGDALLARAYELYNQACVGGDGWSCLTNAEHLEVGKYGAPLDVGKAMEMYARGCELGVDWSCRSGAERLAGTDPTRSAQLLKVACDRGDQRSCAAATTTK